jgi:hypothetical protein
MESLVFESLDEAARLHKPRGHVCAYAIRGDVVFCAIYVDRVRVGQGSGPTQQSALAVAQATRKQG